MQHQTNKSSLKTVKMSPRMRFDLLVNDFTYRVVNDKFVFVCVQI